MAVKPLCSGLCGLVTMGRNRPLAVNAERAASCLPLKPH